MSEPEWIEDSTGTAFEDELCLLLESDADGLGLCGCGNPEHVGKMMREYLDALAWAWADSAAHWAERCGKMATVAGLSPDAWLLCAYLADMKGLTEHGGSVGGAWLTPKGTKMLAALKAAQLDDA